MFVILLLGAMLLSSCDKDGDEQANLASIEYTLNSVDVGTHADIEYTSGFGLIRLEDEPLPWSISFNAVFKLGDALTLKAESEDQSEMSARISVDEQIVASESGTHLVQISYIKGLK